MKRVPPNPINREIKPPTNVFLFPYRFTAFGTIIAAANVSKVMGMNPIPVWKGE